MTIFLRDMSHYDTNESLAGFVGATHKATEGTSYVDAQFAARMNRYHAAGVQVLGSYHVLHTGSLAAQLDHWLSTLDALTPWWRAHPHWVMQIDAERWPTDNVSAATVKAFAQLLVDSGAPGWKVTYASRGQYGNDLAGIPTDLWNAAYHSQTYPGDGAADWAPYSGRTPVLWQYTSTPFDKSAYRGTLDELLTHIEGDDMAGLDPNQARALGNIENVVVALLGNHSADGYVTSVGAPPRSLANALAVAVAAGQVQSVSLSAEDRAALVAALPSATDVAAHLDYDKLAAALAAHIKVS